MIGLFQAIETFIGSPNQLVRLFGILRENGNAVIHADADGEVKRLDHVGKYGFDAAAQREGLRRIRLRQE